MEEIYDEKLFQFILVTGLMFLIVVLEIGMILKIISKAFDIVKHLIYASLILIFLVAMPCLLVRAIDHWFDLLVELESRNATFSALTNYVSQYTYLSEQTTQIQNTTNFYFFETTRQFLPFVSYVVETILK